MPEDQSEVTTYVPLDNLLKPSQTQFINLYKRNNIIFLGDVCAEQIIILATYYSQAMSLACASQRHWLLKVQRGACRHGL